MFKTLELTKKDSVIFGQDQLPSDGNLLTMHLEKVIPDRIGRRRFLIIRRRTQSWKTSSHTQTW